jgi:hypothetical protein
MVGTEWWAPNGAAPRISAKVRDSRPPRKYGQCVTGVDVPRELIETIERSQDPIEILHAVQRLRSFLLEVEARALVEGRYRGVRPEAMAEALGITRQTVYNKLRRLLPGEITPPQGEEIIEIPQLIPEEDER